MSCLSLFISGEREGKTRTCEGPALQRTTVTSGLILSTGVEGHKVTVSHHHHCCSGGAAPPDWDGHNCHGAWRNSPVTSTNHAGQKSASCIKAVHQRERGTPGRKTETHLFCLSVWPPKKDGSDHDQEYLWSSDSKLQYFVKPLWCKRSWRWCDYDLVLSTFINLVQFIDFHENFDWQNIFTLAN